MKSPEPAPDLIQGRTRSDHPAERDDGRSLFPTARWVDRRAISAKGACKLARTSNQGLLMSCRARVELPATPLHVTQGGVNRAATFVADDDCHPHVDLLHGFGHAEGVLIRASVLMGNHVHLLLSTLACTDISRRMRRFGKCHAQALHRRQGRSGTLWQERFKSCLVESERHRLTVYRCIARSADGGVAYPTSITTGSSRCVPC